MSRVRGIRGATTATTAAENSREAILEATSELIRQMVLANEIETDDVAATIFTTTHDLNAEFPAVAARKMGWNNVALMCGHEMQVPGGLPNCIRILMLVNTDKAPQDIVHVYLRGAKNLRNQGVEES